MTTERKRKEQRRGEKLANVPGSGLARDF